MVSPSRLQPIDVGQQQSGKRREMEGIGYHALRHIFVSICIDAGLNLKLIGSYVGHASITTTMDTYGHLLPGSETSAGEIMDSYLAKESNGVS